MDKVQQRTVELMGVVVIQLNTRREILNIRNEKHLTP